MREAVVFETIDMCNFDEVYNLTHYDAQEQREYIDEYYDSAGYPGDGFVTQDEVDQYADEMAQYWFDDEWYCWLDGQIAEIEDCEIIINNAVGPVTSTEPMTIIFRYLLEFDDIDLTASEHIFTREYYSSSEDMDFSFQGPSGTFISRTCSIDDVVTKGNRTTGELEDDAQLIIVFVLDSDNDGYGNEIDRFDNDPSEWADTDGDGIGDNVDEFPLDPENWRDKDNDGVGDKFDEFPDDTGEWIDTDGDGFGDNSDSFPLDENEWNDTDSDGVGDNSDMFPADAAASQDLDVDGRPDEWNEGADISGTELEKDEHIWYDDYDESKVVDRKVAIAVGSLLVAMIFLVIVIVIIQLVVFVKNREEIRRLKRKIKKTSERFDEYMDDDDEEYYDRYDQYEYEDDYDDRSYHRPYTQPRNGQISRKSRYSDREYGRGGGDPEDDFVIYDPPKKSSGRNGRRANRRSNRNYSDRDRNQRWRPRRRY